MTAKELVARLRQSILGGLSVDCISIIYGLNKDEIQILLHEHYTFARAKKLWERAISNQDFSQFIDETICDDLFMELDGKPILYSSMITSDYYAKRVIFKTVGTINLNPLKEYIEEFSKNEWCIIAKKASNELGLNFVVCGPNDKGNEMEVKAISALPSKLINQFLRKAYRELVG